MVFCEYNECLGIWVAYRRNYSYVIFNNFCLICNLNITKAMTMVFGNLTYLVYMALFSWLPISLLVIRYKKYVKKNLDAIMKTFLITFPIVVIWDGISIYSKAWQYSPDRITNIYLLIMPIEEILMLASSILGISIVTALFYEYLHKRKMIK